jgi:hypothetical protein
MRTIGDDGFKRPFLREKRLDMQTLSPQMVLVLRALNLGRCRLLAMMFETV